VTEDAGGAGLAAARREQGPQLVVGALLGWFAVQLIAQAAFEWGGEGPPSFALLGAGQLLVGAGLMWLAVRLEPSHDLLGLRRPLLRSALVGAVACLVCFPLVLLLTNLYREWVLSPEQREAQQSTLELVSRFEDPLQRAVLVAFVGLAIPFVEEVLYRGWLQTGLEGILGRAVGPRSAAVLAVLGSAGVFALSHEPFTRGVIALLGLLLGALYVRTRSLVAPVAFHAVYNVAVVSVRLAGMDG